MKSPYKIHYVTLLIRAHAFPRPRLRALALALSSLLALLLSGCASTPAANVERLKVGMQKQDVLQAMGQPYNIAASGEQETLIYHLWRFWSGLDHDDYWVQLDRGAVTKYGRAGDYDMGRAETLNVNLKQEITTKP